MSVPKNRTITVGQTLVKLSLTNSEPVETKARIIVAQAARQSFRAAPRRGSQWLTIVAHSLVKSGNVSLGPLMITPVTRRSGVTSCGLLTISRMALASCGAVKRATLQPEGAAPGVPPQPETDHSQQARLSS